MSFPKDWEIESINRVTKVGAGGTPSTLNLTYWENGSIPWMSSGELHQKQILDAVGRITELGLKNSNARILPRYCVLIGLAGQGKTRGTVAINMVELSTNQSVAAIYPSPKIDPFYLYHNMDSRYQELRKLSTGEGGRGGLNLQIIGALLIPLPPLDEQKRIAALLGAQDRQIEALSALIALRQRQFRVLVQALISTPAKTGRWNMVELGEVFEILKGKGLSKKNVGANGQYPCILYGELYTTYNRIIRDIYSFTDKYSGTLSKNNDILIPASTTTNGYDLAVAFALHTKGVLLGGDINILRPKFKDIVADFYAYYFTHTIRHIIAHFTQGITIIHLSMNRCSHLPIPLPPAEEQERIASILGAAQRLIACLERKRELCLRRKKGLMQVLLTGKVRV